MLILVLELPDLGIEYFLALNWTFCQTLVLLFYYGSEFVVCNGTTCSNCLEDGWFNLGSGIPRIRLR